jgi:hypothetical protein
MARFQRQVQHLTQEQLSYFARKGQTGRDQTLGNKVSSIAEHSTVSDHDAISADQEVGQR